MLVAVYGTLKSGEENSTRFLPGKVPRFRGFIELPYAMYENGAYPMLVPSSERRPIFVEVYEVDARELRALDDLEGPYGYRRERIHVPSIHLDAEIYVHGAPAPEGFREVPSGDWSMGTGTHS